MPTGCFHPTGSGLPSAADPPQICCYGAEEASRRPPTGRKSQSAGADVSIVTHVLFPVTASESSDDSYCHQMSWRPPGFLLPRFRDPKLHFQYDSRLCLWHRTITVIASIQVRRMFVFSEDDTHVLVSCVCTCLPQVLVHIQVWCWWLRVSTSLTPRKSCECSPASVAVTYYRDKNTQFVHF